MGTRKAQYSVPLIGEPAGKLSTGAGDSSSVLRVLASAARPELAKSSQAVAHDTRAIWRIICVSSSRKPSSWNARLRPVGVYRSSESAGHYR